MCPCEAWAANLAISSGTPSRRTSTSATARAAASPAPPAGTATGRWPGRPRPPARRASTPSVGCGSSIALSRTFPAFSVSRSASSTTITCHRPPDGDACSPPPQLPRVFTRCSAAPCQRLDVARGSRRAPYGTAWHAPQPPTAPCSAAATPAPPPTARPGGPVSSQACVIAPGPAGPSEARGPSSDACRVRRRGARRTDRRALADEVGPDPAPVIVRSPSPLAPTAEQLVGELEARTGPATPRRRAGGTGPPLASGALRASGPAGASGSGGGSGPAWGGSGGGGGAGGSQAPRAADPTAPPGRSAAAAPRRSARSALPSRGSCSARSRRPLPVDPHPLGRAARPRAFRFPARRPRALRLRLRQVRPLRLHACLSRPRLSRRALASRSPRRRGGPCPRRRPSAFHPALLASASARAFSARRALPSPRPPPPRSRPAPSPTAEHRPGPLRDHRGDLRFRAASLHDEVAPRVALRQVEKALAHPLVELRGLRLHPVRRLGAAGGRDARRDVQDDVRFGGRPWVAQRESRATSAGRAPGRRPGRRARSRRTGR